MFEGFSGLANAIVTVLFGGGMLGVLVWILIYQQRQVNELKLGVPTTEEEVKIYLSVVRSKVRRFLVYTSFPILLLVCVWIIMWMGGEAGRAAFEALYGIAMLVAGIYIGSRLVKDKD